MRFFYLIAAHNENDGFGALVTELQAMIQRFPGSQVLIIENGSTDDSQKTLMELAAAYPWLKPIFETRKGMGHAFRRGLQEVSKIQSMPGDWVVFTAADLPFGFSDLEQFLQLQQKHSDVRLFIGSKAHRLSVVKRSWKRTFASRVFQDLRWILLGMKTKDPQGTLFLRMDQAGVGQKTKSPDYFFTTELVSFQESVGPVIEMPVVLRADLRPSKVRLVNDGLKVLRQCFDLARRKSNGDL